MEGVKTGMSSPSKPRYAADRDSTHAETIQIETVTGVSSGALILLLICYRLNKMNTLPMGGIEETGETRQGSEFFNLSFLGAVSPGLHFFQKDAGASPFYGSESPHFKTKGGSPGRSRIPAPSGRRCRYATSARIKRSQLSPPGVWISLVPYIGGPSLCTIDQNLRR